MADVVLLVITDNGVAQTTRHSSCRFADTGPLPAACVLQTPTAKDRGSAMRFAPLRPGTRV